MDEAESPYFLLGLRPGATHEELRRAFKQRARETHPDKGGDVELFRKIRAAYDKLRAVVKVDPDHIPWDGVDPEERVDVRLFRNLCSSKSRPKAAGAKRTQDPPAVPKPHLPTAEVPDAVDAVLVRLWRKLSKLDSEDLVERVKGLSGPVRSGLQAFLRRAADERYNFLFVEEQPPSAAVRRPVAPRIVESLLQNRQPAAKPDAAWPRGVVDLEAEPAAQAVAADTPPELAATCHLEVPAAATTTKGRPRAAAKVVPKPRGRPRKVPAPADGQKPMPRVRRSRAKAVPKVPGRRGRRPVTRSQADFASRGPGHDAEDAGEPGTPTEPTRSSRMPRVCTWIVSVQPETARGGPCCLSCGVPVQAGTLRGTSEGCYKKSSKHRHWHCLAGLWSNKYTLKEDGLTPEQFNACLADVGTEATPKADGAQQVEGSPTIAAGWGRAEGRGRDRGAPVRRRARRHESRASARPALVSV